MRKRKHEFRLYSFYDITGMERHLEKMAAKGWMLEKATPLGWTYRRCEPKRVHFAVTYYTPASAFQPEPNEDQQTFTDFCGHAGWRCAGSYSHLMVFVNEQEHPVPIHTDPMPEIESIEHVARRITWVWWLLLAMCLFQAWTFVDFLLQDPITALSSSILLASQLMMTLLALYVLSDLVTWYRWRKQARAAAENGEFVHTHGHQWLLIAAIVVLILGLLASLIVDRQLGFGRFLLILPAVYFLSYFLINGVRVFLQRKKVATGLNRLITLTASLLLSLVLCVVLPQMILHMVHPISHTVDFPITIQDLTGEADEGLTKESASCTSLLVSSRNFTQHPPFDQPSKGRKTLYYTQSDIHVGPLYDLVLERVVHQFDRWNTRDETKLRLYQETDPAPWGAQAAYQYVYDGIPDSSYILCWPGRIVEFHTNWYLTKTQMSMVGSCFSQ